MKAGDSRTRKCIQVSFPKISRETPSESFRGIATKGFMELHRVQYILVLVQPTFILNQYG